MKILGLDTATRTASVAILDQDRILADCRAGETNGAAESGQALNLSHSQGLLALIRTALARAKTNLTELSAAAVTVGPGSFTGLRVGLSTVKGLVYGTGLAVAGVSTLEAVAHCCKNHNGLIVPLIDARRGELYAAIFKCAMNVVSRLTPDAMYEAEQLADSLREHLHDGRCLFVAVDNCSSLADKLICLLGGEGQVQQSDRSSISIAAAVAEIGSTKIDSGRHESIADLVPRYLQLTAAEINRSKTI